MLAVRYDHGNLEYGLGASLPLGRGAGRDARESHARSFGQRLIVSRRGCAVPPLGGLNDAEAVARLIKLAEEYEAKAAKR